MSNPLPRGTEIANHRGQVKQTGKSPAIPFSKRFDYKCQAVQACYMNARKRAGFLVALNGTRKSLLPNRQGGAQTSLSNFLFIWIEPARQRGVMIYRQGPAAVATPVAGFRNLQFNKFAEKWIPPSCWSAWLQGLTVVSRGETLQENGRKNRFPGCARWMSFDTRHDSHKFPITWPHLWNFQSCLVEWRRRLGEFEVGAQLKESVPHRVVHSQFHA